MELTSSQTTVTKGVAILMMLCLHLFNNLSYGNLFTPLIFIGDAPLIYYISLFCDCCVAIYCFCSGYGLYIGYCKNPGNYNYKNKLRLVKLYINYWIILLLFVVCLGVALNRESAFPGNWSKFLLNFTAVHTSYNGAWWFLTTYILLVLSSPMIFSIVKRYKTYLVVSISFLVYVAAYVQRIKVPIVMHQVFLDGVLSKVSLYGMSLFPFILGTLAAKEKWYTRFSTYFDRVRFSNFILIGIIIASIIFHALVPTLFIAVFTGVIFIFCFNKIDLPPKFNNILMYLSSHSTNIWLTHMFFYLTYFKGLVFATKYPIFIYLGLLILCVVSSYLINLIYNPINRIINLKADQNLKSTK